VITLATAIGFIWMLNPKQNETEKVDS
jgi:hypothetical protein